MDYGMGGFIVLIGLAILLAPKLGLPLVIDNFQRYLFTGLFVLYGGFRIYRGRQKDYYKD